MDVRTATQMERAKRNAIAISVLMIIMLLGLASTFIALSFMDQHAGSKSPVINNEIPINGPDTPLVTPSWVMPIDSNAMTVLKAANFDMLQKNNTTSWYEFDLGYTLGAAEGTSVVACYDGKVTSVIESGDASTGKLVRIQHTDGKETVYSSLDTITVKKGDTVKRGDKIGTVGNTAYYETFAMPHVRLMAYQNGKAINPEEFLDFPNSENK